MKITVTAEDIEKGKPAAAEQCALALACRRAGLVNASVDNDTIDFWLGSAQLPASAQLFIEMFDGGLEVEPFEFELEVPA